jgi:hypothetical protein
LLRLLDIIGSFTSLLRLLDLIAHGRTVFSFAHLGDDNPSDEAFKFCRKYF